MVRAIALERAPSFWAFGLVWSGQTVSLIGSGLTSFALGVFVYQRTGSVTDFSLVTLATYLPAILVSPFAGVLVDRWDHRRTMIVSDSLAALSSIALLLLYTFAELELWHVILMTAMSSASTGLQAPAYAAATTVLVPGEQLGRANGLVQLGSAGQYVIAPVLAGSLLEPLGIRGIILVDLGTFLCSLAILLVLRFPGAPPSAEGSAAKRELLADLRFGFEFIRARSDLLAFLVFLTAAFFVGGFAIVLDAPLMLSFTNAEVLGRQLAIGGLGMIAGGALMSVWRGNGRRIRALFIAELINAACMVLASLRPSATLITISGFFWFFSVAIIVGTDQTIWQLRVPADVQGRVLGTKRMIQLCAMPLAYVLAGPLVDGVFAPLMSESGALADSFGRVIGVGPGRGIALLWLLGGLLKLAIACVALRHAPLRRIESAEPR